jgi:hypothetical protein
LFGKKLAVIRERSGRGPTYVVVELPDGRKRPIRIASTDLAAMVITSGAASDLPRISIRTLIPLVQHLSANLALLAEEVIRDGSSSPSASRCVSTTADTRRRIPPAADGASALWPNLSAETQTQIARTLAELMRRIQPPRGGRGRESGRADRPDHR